jgi:alkylation response protein AidB-like acyl-CoA dehydrogenase
VQTLLGRTHAALATGSALLDGLSDGALRPGSLTRSLASRATLAVESCAAASDALQVFGGSGYMRDTGVEKLLRDQNHLRVCWGSPPELRRFVTELERTS